MPRAEAQITNKRGLHARASAKFVKLAASFEADVRVTKDGQSVDARSIMGLMMLAAGPGCCIDITANGDQADGSRPGAHRTGPAEIRRGTPLTPPLKGEGGPQTPKNPPPP